MKIIIGIPNKIILQSELVCKSTYFTYVTIINALINCILCYAISNFDTISSIMNSASFRFQNIISQASREKCMANLKKFRVPSLKTGKPASSATAAVLIPLCSVNDQTSILYTVRATNLRSDSGHISFPGGKTDKNESPIQTALRETQEEIGISPDRVDIWGCGEAVPGRKNKIMISPVIGFIQDLQESDLCLNSREVSEVFAAPLEMLCDPKNHFYTQFKNGYILPVFSVHEFKIWGVTAYMTHIFLTCLLPKDVYKNDWMRKKIVIQN